MPHEQVTTDAWNPGQYLKFAAERAQPFFDLLEMVEPVPGGDVIDLGCGTGELTARLHAHTRAATTVGVDSSEAMLAEARPLAGDGLRFDHANIARFDAEHRFDLIFTNAALHWVPDHPRLLDRLTAGLRPGGQLAVQVPANADHPSHTVAAELAREAPFWENMADTPSDEVPGVLSPQRYAEVLDELGYAEQHVRLQVYGHHLASTADVVEWTKGTTLLRFQELLPPELFDSFVDRYRQRLVAVLGERAPYFYPFKRILFWARLPGLSTVAERQAP
jgi:trans-aconitate 2-methyltransferase